MTQRCLWAVPGMVIGSCQDYGRSCSHRAAADASGCLRSRSEDWPSWRLAACVRSSDDMSTLRLLVHAGRPGFPLARASDHQVVEHVRRMLERGELCWSPLDAPGTSAHLGDATGSSSVATTTVPATARPHALATPAALPKPRADVRSRIAPPASQPAGASPVQVTQTTRHWIAIELVGEDGSPIPDEPYSVELPGGRLCSGRLDQRGSARIDNIEGAGMCHVSFPRLDGAAWEAATR